MLCWLHKISAEKIESFPLQLSGLLMTDMYIECGLWYLKKPLWKEDRPIWDSFIISMQSDYLFFRKLLKGLQYIPRVIITDKLKSYGAAKRELLPGVEHRQHKRLINRAENSHQPTRLREKKWNEIIEVNLVA